MIKIQNKKLGFSLVEALVSMLILSIFFAAGAKVITKKKKPDKITYPHGYYECYYNGETLYSGESTNFAPPETKSADGSSCSFTPGMGKAIYKITVIYPDAQGGYSEVVPFINNNLVITPSNGETDTKILVDGDELQYNQNNTTYDEIRSYLKFTNPTSGVYTNNVGNSGNAGGVIIAW